MPQAEPDPAPPAMRAVRAVLAGIATGLAGAGVAVLSAGVTAAVMSVRSLVTPPRSRHAEPVRVHAHDPARGLITLARTARSAAPGTYTITYGGGRGVARIAELAGGNDHVVTRRVSEPVGASLAGVRRVALASSPQRGPGDLGIPWYETRVLTELGPALAWAFPAPGKGRDWAVHVHGRGAPLTETLRSVPLFREAGWSSLVVSYRNDPEAPAAPDGRYGLGFTEWRDVEAGIGWALERGARRILLSGWSMGGAAVMQAILRSPLASRVTGIMLESPVLSWAATLRMQGRLLRLPGWVISLGMWFLRGPLAGLVAGVRAPLPLRDGEIGPRAGLLRVPVLLLHSREDGTVPAAPSARLAQARPDLVEYAEFERGQHTRLWNVDPSRWEGIVRAWLEGFRASAAGAAGDVTGDAAAREAVMGSSPAPTRQGSPDGG